MHTLLDSPCNRDSLRSYHPSTPRPLLHAIACCSLESLTVCSQSIVTYCYLSLPPVTAQPKHPTPSTPLSGHIPHPAEIVVVQRHEKIRIKEVKGITVAGRITRGFTKPSAVSTYTSINTIQQECFLENMRRILHPIRIDQSHKGCIGKPCKLKRRKKDIQM